MLINGKSSVVSSATIIDRRLFPRELIFEGMKRINNEILVFNLQLAEDLIKF